MSPTEVLQTYLDECCPEIHAQRLQALFDVATALQGSKSFSITAIGRNLNDTIDIKHRIKKVDRLMSNEHLYHEMESIYKGLSHYVFRYIGQDKKVPIVVDLCYLKDDHDIQMLSAEIATKGRSIPIYREVFEKNNLKGRAKEFIRKLSRCVPADKKVLIIMDAAFGEDWFSEISSQNWYWLVRARGGKYLKLSEADDWQEASDLFSKASSRAKDYPYAFITKKQSRPCRVIMKSDITSSPRKRPSRLPRNYNSANGNYKRSAKEPWILATNLPKEECPAAQVILYYKKRMQIEESFRDVKSHQYGLGARNIRTHNVFRWGIKMLLAAITQITLWIIGIVGHSKGYQRVFQANTVKDKKVFSYFYLGHLIVYYEKLNELSIDYEKLPSIIEEELARKW